MFPAKNPNPRTGGWIFWLAIGVFGIVYAFQYFTPVSIHLLELIALIFGVAAIFGL